jgi:O-antigen/teichoic acid export membrane protein
MKHFALRLGVDRAVFFTLLGRGWSVLAGLLTIIVIAHFLTPELQGYYYTFNSLIALQLFAELGLNYVVIQFASHEMAKLSWLPDGTVTGDAEAKRRLQSLMHFAFSWFGVAGLIMIVILIPAGLYFFNTGSQAIAASHNVSVPWIFLVIFTAANLFVTAAAAILEGCGKVAQVAVMRLWQSLFAVTMVWAVLSMGGHLYALTVSSLMMTVIGFTWLWYNHRNFFKDLMAHRTLLLGMSWRKEIWPFQWRIAVSWMSGYLIFQLFNPLLFKTHGPIAAGQMGMSLQIIGAMNGAAMAWISTKAPTYGKMIANKQRRELDALFAQGLFQSLVFLILCILALWTILYFLNEANSPYALRTLPLHLFSLLFLASIANQIIFAEATYLRAHKEEPFMFLSVSMALTIALLAIMFVPSLGASAAVYSYVATTLVMGLVGGTTIFLYKRKQWRVQHHDNV